jgi:hypothetical protein
VLAIGAAFLREPAVLTFIALAAGHSQHRVRLVLLIEVDQHLAVGGYHVDCHDRARSRGGHGARNLLARSARQYARDLAADPFGPQRIDPVRVERRAVGVRHQPLRRARRTSLGHGVGDHLPDLPLGAFGRDVELAIVPAPLGNAGWQPAAGGMGGKVVTGPRVRVDRGKADTARLPAPEGRAATGGGEVRRHE